MFARPGEARNAEWVEIDFDAAEWRIAADGNRARPMSDATITNALRNVGYTGDEMTVYSFRSMASTRLNEMGWNRDAIERQLAHVEGNAVRAAYNHAEHLGERLRMMQAWGRLLGRVTQQSRCNAYSLQWESRLIRPKTRCTVRR